MRINRKGAINRPMTYLPICHVQGNECRCISQLHRWPTAGRRPQGPAACHPIYLRVLLDRRQLPRRQVPRFQISDRTYRFKVAHHHRVEQEQHLHPSKVSNPSLVRAASSKTCQWLLRLDHLLRKVDSHLNRVLQGQVLLQYNEVLLLHHHRKSPLQRLRPLSHVLQILTLNINYNHRNGWILLRVCHSRPH